MGNTNIVLAANIQKFRKQCGFTQEELAEKLGVTFQAVSKWENAKSAPDILFLPVMADLFNCSIDELFSREVKSQNSIDLPWDDDSTIRIFQAQGKKIIKSQENNSCLEVSFPKNCNETTRQYFKVEVLGNLFCDSSINGDVVCQGKLQCYQINGDISGGCNAEGDIEVGGSLSGGCNCGDNISCGGDISGDINCGGAVKADGDIEADTIKCDSISCNTLKCDRIGSNVKIN